MPISRISRLAASGFLLIALGASAVIGQVRGEPHSLQIEITIDRAKIQVLEAVPATLSFSNRGLRDLKVDPLWFGGEYPTFAMVVTRPDRKTERMARVQLKLVHVEGPDADLTLTVKPGATESVPMRIGADWDKQKPLFDVAGAYTLTFEWTLDEERRSAGPFQIEVSAPGDGDKRAYELLKSNPHPEVIYEPQLLDIPAYADSLGPLIKLAALDSTSVYCDYARLAVAQHKLTEAVRLRVYTPSPESRANLIDDAAELLQRVNEASFTHPTLVARMKQMLKAERAATSK